MYSFNVKEVVEYREAVEVGSGKMEVGSLELEAGSDKQGNDDVVEYAFAKAKKEKPLIILPTTTDAEIEAITKKLEDSAENLKIKFTNRKRNEQGILVKLQVETKYPSQNRFYENVTFSNKEKTSIPDIYLKIVNGNDLQFSDTEGKMIFRTSLEGVKAELFPKNDQVQMPKIGENPIYIVNGAIKTSEEVKDKILQLDGDAKLLGKEEAIAKYGSKAKDGALVLNGTTVIKDKESPKVEKAVSTTNEVFMKINKTTTDAQLLAYKEELMRDHGLDLSYNLRRNEAREITMIQISYSGEAKNGNYSISGDNPIDEFFFFIDEEGNTGFWSEKFEKNTKAQRDLIDVRRAQLEKAREERRGALEGRREQLEGAREERREAYKERRDALLEAREERKKALGKGKEAMKERQEEMKTGLRERSEEMKERQQKLKELRSAEKQKAKKFNFQTDSSIKPLYIIDGKRVTHEEFIATDTNTIERMDVLKNQNATAKYGKDGENGVVVIETKTSSEIGAAANKTIRITANSTNAEIEAISNRLTVDGATLSIKKIKRNSLGEITSYKLKFDDGQGSQISSSSRGTNNAIQPLVISYDSNGKISIVQ